MLSLISKVVAPDVPAVTDFRQHWNQFLHYYATKPHSQLKSEPIEATRLTFHLNKMLKLLVEEQAEAAAKGVGGMSPSLEYLLNTGVLDILVTLCQADSPPGVRPYIINVFIFLLEKIKYPLLPETACHQPLRRLVLICGLTKASPTESQEMKLLTILCGKIRAKPDLIHIFLDWNMKESCVTPNSFDTSRESSGRLSQSQGDSLDLANIERLAINVEAALSNLQHKHLIATALLNYLDSADYLLSCTAMESLSLIAALDNDLASKALVMDSPFIPALLSRLNSLFRAIPDSVEPARLEEILVNWLQVHHYHSPDMEDPTFVGRSELLAFFSFVDYLDQNCRESHSFSAERLAAEVREQFLQEQLTPLLQAEEESQVVLGLALTAQVWLHIKSDQLAHSFATWLLGEKICPGGGEEGGGLSGRLVELCRQGGGRGVEAVRTVDVLLSSSCQYILDRLVTAQLETRGYHLSSNNPEAIINSWSDVEDEREKLENSLVESSPPSRTRREVTPCRTLAPSNIHRLVNSWLYLVPDQLKLDEVRGSGYDQYVVDATQQVQNIARECAAFDWPREATGAWDGGDAGSSDSRVEADPSRAWSEGQFLAAMLDMMETCLDNDYDTNLQLTSVLSRLAQLPHPYLHEYLLNPTIPLGPGVRTLYTVLKSVLAEAVTRTESVPHFPLKMLHCRKKLLGDQTQISPRREIEIPEEELKLLESILVLDEFCKELAAVTFVKYQCFA